MYGSCLNDAETPPHECTDIYIYLVFLILYVTCCEYVLTDVVYDEIIIPHLVRVLSCLLNRQISRAISSRQRPSAIISSTVRNVETRDQFLVALGWCSVLYWYFQQHAILLNPSWLAWLIITLSCAAEFCKLLCKVFHVYRPPSRCSLPVCHTVLHAFPFNSLTKSSRVMRSQLCLLSLHILLFRAITRENY